MDWLHQNARNILFWFGASFTVIAPIVIGIGFDDESTSWVAALCGAFITFISKLDQIAELSLGPVKAKMREAIQEANATITQLQDVAVRIARPTLATLMAGNFGFQDGLKLRERLDLHDDLVNDLREIGVSEKDIDGATQKWDDGIGVIYHRAIGVHIDRRKHKNEVNPDATDKEKADKEAWQNTMDFPNWRVLRPPEMRKFMADRNIDNSQIRGWIDDYEHFLNTKEIRRREEFVQQ